MFGIKRIGHGGTLDPAVEGVLPIAVGQATRLLRYLPEEKSYRGVIQLGTQTDTDDLQGKIISNKHWPELTSKTLNEVLNQFRGTIQQTPPQISSVHFKGERAYKRARKGEKMELPSKTITIHDLTLQGWDQSKGQLKFKLSCSSGTYVRSLARDLGEFLGCYGCLSNLYRTSSLGFQEKDTIELPEINDSLILTRPQLIEPINSLSHLTKIQLETQDELLYWRTGRKIETSEDRYKSATNFLSPEQSQFEEEITVVIEPEGKLAGIGNREGFSFLHPKIVFQAN